MPSQPMNLSVTAATFLSRISTPNATYSIHHTSDSVKEKTHNIVRIVLVYLAGIHTYDGRFIRGGA